jgi:Zn-dependent peptidase ImmA (M78 family)
MSKAVAYKAPAAVLQELGVTEASELNIEAIAQYCGATILYEPLSGCAARILGAADRAIITIDSQSTRERQRFSAGHELGHWMHDRHRVAFGCTVADLRNRDTDNPERRANRYAADLLLPRTMFKTHARSVAPTFECIRQLAKIFTMSMTATAIRFVEIGDWPAMIIASNGTGRKWFVSSDTVPRKLWPRSMPGENTMAARLMQGYGRGSESPVEVDADEWIEGPDAGRFSLREDSILVKAGEVLSLLWWQNEAHLGATGDDEDALDELSGELRFR